MTMLFLAFIVMPACGQQNDSPRRTHHEPYTFVPIEKLAQQAQAILASNTQTPSSIENLFHYQNEMTAAEFMAFLTSFESCRTLPNGRIERTNCPAFQYMVSGQVRKRDIHPAAKAQVIEYFLTSDKPVLRSAAFYQVTGSEPDSFYEPLLSAVQKENDPSSRIASFAALQAYITNNHAYTNEADQLFSQATTSPSRQIRYLTAQTFGFKSVAQDHSDHLDTLIDMFDDDDFSVRAAAISSSATYNDSKVVPHLSAILANPNLASLHADAVHALNRLWLDYPLYQNHSVEAYKAFTDYLSSNYSNRIPAPGTLDDLTLVNTSSSAYATWLSGADYFDAQELISILNCIAHSTSVEKTIQQASQQAIRAFGGTFDDETDQSTSIPNRMHNEIACSDMPPRHH